MNTGVSQGSFLGPFLNLWASWSVLKTSSLIAIHIAMHMRYGI